MQRDVFYHKLLKKCLISLDLLDMQLSVTCSEKGKNSNEDDSKAVIIIFYGNTGRRLSGQIQKKEKKFPVVNKKDFLPSLFVEHLL